MEAKLKKEYQDRMKYKRIINIIVAIVFLAVVIWSTTGVKYEGTIDGSSKSLRNLFLAFLEPDFDYLMKFDIDGLPYAVLETLAIAVGGTFFSALLSIPFALLASQNIVGKRLSKLGKVIITVIRTFPEMILAIIFIKIVGPGAFAGVLALGFHSIGMLGKLFSESIESMDMGPAESLDASGATHFQKLVSAVLPTVMPELLSYTLYRFEINTRAATTLGIVGAGGIGFPLIMSITGNYWGRVSMILITMIITVVIVDMISGSIRKRLT